MRSWVWLRCSPSCLCLPQFVTFLSHIRIPFSGSLESISVYTGICIYVDIYVSLGSLFGSCPRGRHFSHLLKASISYFDLFWTSSITSFDGMYSIFCSDASASFASLPQCSLFSFSLLSCGPFLYFGSHAASLKWFFSQRCFSWFSLDSKNSDRTPI